MSNELDRLAAALGRLDGVEVRRHAQHFEIELRGTTAYTVWVRNGRFVVVGSLDQYAAQTLEAVVMLIASDARRVRGHDGSPATPPGEPPG